MTKNIILLTAILLILTINTTSGRSAKYPLSDNHAVSNPLILTSLIESGQINDARNQSKVNLPGFEDLESYSGFFTVNKTCGSNMFFWYFPAETYPEEAPVVLYLQGGPGGSSLVSTLVENGPIHMLENGKVVRANYSWSLYYHLIYIDNPVDVGFSFTDGLECIPTEESLVGSNLYSAVVQFFLMFPELQKNDFFITGVSYAGKYAPALAYTVHKKNQNAELKINLKGIALENGLISLLDQHRYSPHLYEIGLIDEDGRKQFEDQEDQITKAIEAKNWELASEVEYNLITTAGNSFFYNLTGLMIYQNYLLSSNVSSALGIAILEYFSSKEIKEALHTGNIEFKANSDNVTQALHSDVSRSVAPMVKELLNNAYKVLLFNGQLDVIVSYPLTRDFVNRLEFKGKSEFKSAKRFIWQVDQDVAGYVREGGNLSLALVRNAGHVVAGDKPKWVLDLLLGFTKPDCVVLQENRRRLKKNCRL